MADLFIAMADIHGNTEMLEKIVREHEKVRAVFAAGDITNFGQDRDARRVLSIFSRLVPETPLYFVAGNCDTKSARAEFNTERGYLERRSAPITLSKGAELRAIGAGGGIYHTGMTPFELKENDLEFNLNAAFAPYGADATTNLIVLTHTPPRDTFADMRASRHLGSGAFEAFLYEHEPLLWICGHIHESRSARREGATLLVNPGPAAHGYYALIAVEDGTQGLRVAAELRSV